jgi:hypothetical protein
MNKFCSKSQFLLKSDVYASSTTEPYKKATPIITDWNGTTYKNTNESYNMILTLCYLIV